MPDDWTTDETDYGSSAQSPEKDVFFSVEFVSVLDIPAMLKNNDNWMNENKTRKVDPKKAETTIVETR